MNRITITLAIVIILLGYLYLSKPGEVVVTESGRVSGIINKGRSALQGERFWKNQLKIATEVYNNSVAPRPPTSTELRELYQKMREDQKALDTRMKDLYTQEEQMASSLRIKADSIERAAKWSKLDEEDEKIRLREIDKIKKIVQVIESHLHVDKAQSIVK